MHICWSERNRLALIRIPLWWNFISTQNERENTRKTIEYRAPDPFANTFLLFAGMAVAINHAMENAEESLKTAEKLHVNAKGKGRGKKLKTLPKSCHESAKNLWKDRKIYEANGVFPKKLIEKTIEKLRAYRDKDLWKNMAGKPEKIEKLIRQYIHHG